MNEGRFGGDMDRNEVEIEFDWFVLEKFYVFKHGQILQFM